jgi:hypothetical protein
MRAQGDSATPWGAAIGAVGALGAAEINKSSKPSTGGSSTADSPQTIAAANQALSQGESIANRQYTPYTGQVVQPLSSNEQQGVAQASPTSALNTGAASAFSQAAGDIAGIKQYNQQNLQQYMDPYVQSVLTPQLTQENINYNAQRSALLNSKAGAFGGDRSALEAGQLDYAHGQTIASDVGNAYSKAYTNAQSAFFQDQQKQIAAANALDQVGGDMSKLNTQQIQDLMATGGLERALGQKQLDFNYQQFIENRDWSVTNLQPLLNSIAASKGTQQTVSNYGPPSNIAGQAIGAAATVAGAYFTGGQSLGNQNTMGNEQTSNEPDFNQPDTPGEVAATSDERLKTDIVMLGHLPSGLPFYEFRYVHNPHRLWVGVLAHEAAWVFPEAVQAGPDGYLRVRYDRIH